MLLLRAGVYTLLIIFILSAKGSKGTRVITVIAEGKQWSNNGNTSNLLARPCVDHNCSYYSLDQVLSNLTSNVLINITTSIRLSSMISLVGLTNVSIKGYQNPTINCKRYGGLHFVSCHNLTIDGITWEGCGSEIIGNNESSHSVIKLYNSTSIAITNCTFQYSLGQAIVLSGVSGDVNIKCCNFSSNKHYKGNGMAIHYSDSLNTSTPIYLSITGCNFYYNEGGISVVYFGQATKAHKFLFLQNSGFYQNNAICIYLSNQTFHINGNVVFYNNTADRGGGIFITDYSNVVFYKNSEVSFVNNTAKRFGGAIFITNRSSILFGDNTLLPNQEYVKDLHGNQKLEMVVTFDSNKANRFGGAIYVNNSNLVFGNNAMVAFNKNEAVEYDGGAICTDTSSFVIFGENSIVTFHNNRANWAGGAVLIYATIFTFRGNAMVNFTNNTAADGGALYIYYSSDVKYEGNSMVMFSHNKAQKFCGAIYMSNSTATFERNSTVEFSDNNANIASGATCIDISNVTFRGNTTVVFNKNRAEQGGGLYVKDTSNVTFKGNSSVSFYGNEATYGGAVLIAGLSVVTFEQNSSVSFHGNQADHSGGAAVIRNSSVIFEDSTTALFHTNVADFGGAVYLFLSSNATFIGNCAVTFYDNVAKQICGALYITDSTATFEETSTIKFDYNHANFSGGALCTGNSNMIFGGNSAVTFNNNEANLGGAMFIVSISIIMIDKNVTSLLYDDKFSEIAGCMFYDSSSMTFNGNSTVTLSNNTANAKGGAIFTWNVSLLFQGSSQIKFYKNTCKPTGYGGAMCVSNSTVTFHENTIVTFNSNTADNGGAIFIANSSFASFEGNSAVQIHNNEAYVGGAVFAHISIVSFDGNSSVVFSDNQGNAFSSSSGAMCIFNSSITFDNNSTVTFYNNKGNACGGALYATFSNTTIKGQALVRFISNRVIIDGGALCINRNSNITFTGRSTTIVKNNQAALLGGAMSGLINATITFEGDSVVVFNNNTANTGGALYITDYSDVTFKDNASVTFYDNEAFSGGALCTDNYSNAILQGNSIVTFSNNKADYSLGGAVYILYHSSLTVQGNSTVTLNDNNAEKCGAMCIYNSTATFKGNSLVVFNHNRASINGGAMCISNSSVTFGGKSTVTFTNNGAIHGYGGAAYIDRYSTLPSKGTSTDILFCYANTTRINHHSNVTFQENSIAIFSFNEAYNGGAIYSYNKGHVTFRGNSTTTFKNNIAIQSGGVLYSYAYCGVSFKENSAVTFSHNKALQGGVMYSQLNSYIKFEGNSVVTFTTNAAVEHGGAINLFTNTLMLFTNHARVMFNSNVAKSGGAVYSDSTFITISNSTNSGANITSLSNITFAENSTIAFINNTASQDGGSIYLSDHSNFVLAHNSKVSFNHCVARDYGGAIYAKFEDSLLHFNISDIHFADNRAGTRNNSVYINVLKSCNINCLHENTKGINEHHFPVATSPSKLIFYNPARCINGTNPDCNTYFINNIMLGQEIILNGCLLDYYNQPAETAQFLVTSMDQGFKIDSSNYISISCNRTIEGIRIIGDLKESKSYNYSMTISLHVSRISESKIITVNLKVQFVQCHPGFLYSKESQRCECYNKSEIVSCSGSSSTIKRGYWFGSVTGKSTVTTCPNNYCSFTCCEITNGIYHLSPVRITQCTSHRSGVACGNCEDGYTLSFDSTQCIGVNKCTTGHTILVTTLTLLYWISIIIAVFTLMYFKVPIGSLYAIVYYYSVVDILLSQDYYILSGLYTAISIMSSLAKLTPQFLGQLCLVRNMSGIDQQFIHYIHPAAVSLFLILLSIIARRSRRVSSLIGRGIINFICFILLLSYTSVATTSLLLMRSLKFMDIGKVYTYLSPDIEYFHGRHLAYVFVAILFTILIVIGLPLLLLLEPFLNSKINFIKIKPLLDQFQGCYKDKYRSFAAYYMICRIVIILLVIVRIFDDFTTQYLLLIACALVALIHLITRPYAKMIHNLFDGVMLQLIVIISILPIVEFVDNYNRGLVVAVTYLLIILPVISFIIIKFLLHKNEISNAIKFCIVRLSRYAVVSNGGTELLPIHENGTNSTNDRMRRNSTTTMPAVTQDDEQLPDMMWCREPFLEVLKDIDDLN